MFPTTYQIIGNYLILLLVSLGALSVGSFMLYQLIRHPDTNKFFEPTWQSVGLALLAFFIGAYGWFSIFSGIYWAFRHRIDPQRISEIRLTRIEPDLQRPGPERVITDRALIAEGLALLRTASSYYRSHETFQDGFGIGVRVDGADAYSPLHIVAYRQSNRSERNLVPVNVVVVNGTMKFQCPAFHDWLRKNVDPLFAAQP